MERVMAETQTASPAADIPKMTGPHLPKSWVAATFLLSICLCAWGFVRASSGHEKDDSNSRLMLAVSRLMLADEIGMNGDFQQASDSLEQVLTERDSKASSANSKDAIEVFKLAGTIRDSLEKSDRKSAVESFIDFKQKAEAFESKTYQVKSYVQVGGLNLQIIIGLLGMLVSLCTIWWLLERSDHSCQALTLEGERSHEELENLKFRFEEEQRRTIDLQQRLMDLGKTSKKMESSLEDYSRATSQLESGVKYLKTSLADSESKLKRVETDLSETVRLRQEAEVKISSLQTLLDAAERTESALHSRLQTLEVQKNEQYDQFSAKISELVSQARTVPVDSLSQDLEQPSGTDPLSSGVQSLQMASLPPDLEKMQSELIQEKSRIQTEFAVIEWSNAKLQKEIEELKAELSSARVSFVQQEKETREKFALLETTYALEKVKALDSAAIQYESEIKFLREQLRVANDHFGERSA
jgi:hypothetical protein